MNLLAVIEKLEEEWNKARLSVCTCNDVAINESCAVCSYESNALGFQPALLEALKEAEQSMTCSCHDMHYPDEKCGVCEWRKKWTTEEKEADIQIAKSLKEKLAIAVEALEKVMTQNRMRGYPTGREWAFLVVDANEALEKLK